ncbi:MAG: hypothetical protein NCW75_08200 [Phycisphaera sp.]|nr:MAG: hypothetical protein NCW75_08200 [Phycisphaera sp.]
MGPRVIGLFVGGFLAATATAQVIPDVGIVMTADNPELRPGESTLVTLSAAWLGASTRTYDIAVVETNLVSSAGSMGLSDPMLIDGMAGPGTMAGEISPTGVDGILAGKLNWPFPIFPPPPYPLPFWQATYTAPADVAAPFDVELSTLTTRFDAYIEMSSSETVSLIDEIVEGRATIRVVPAPAGTMVLGLAVFGFGRPRRR